MLKDKYIIYIRSIYIVDTWYTFYVYQIIFPKTKQLETPYLGILCYLLYLYPQLSSIIKIVIILFICYVCL